VPRPPRTIPDLDARGVRLERAATVHPPVHPARGVALAAVLVIAVGIVGWAAIDAPPAFPAEWEALAREPALLPGLTIGGRFHAVLAAPARLRELLPRLTAALDGASGADPVFAVRRTNVLLHIAAALLLWSLLHGVALRVRCGPTPVVGLAWAVALLWATHPLHVGAVAIAGQRGPLISTVFVLAAIALQAHPALRRRAGSAVAFLIALILATASSALPIWLPIVLLVEVWIAGPPAAIRSVRGGGALVVALAGVALATLQPLPGTSTLDSSTPLARAALGAGQGVAALLGTPVPNDLPPWALGRGLAAMGALGIVVLAVGAAWFARLARWRGVAVGLAWCAAVLIVNAAFVAWWRVPQVAPGWSLALAGIALAALVAALRAAELAQFWGKTLAFRASTPLLTLAGLALLVANLPRVIEQRSTVVSARRQIERCPADPRALMQYGYALHFAAHRPVADVDRAQVPAGVDPQTWFAAESAAALERLPALAESAAWLTSQQRGVLQMQLLRQSLRAGLPLPPLPPTAFAGFVPDKPDDALLLARISRDRGDVDAAVARYERAEQLLPPDNPHRADVLAEFATYLMFDLNRDAEACPRFAEACDTPAPSLEARTGLALCMIRDARYGTGAEGFERVSAVLAERPDNVRAGLVLAEYWLRSHGWTQAAQVYGAILHDHPAYYPALRGFHEVCLQTGALDQAVAAWRRAVAAADASDMRPLRSYLVWALAIADDPQAADAATSLLRTDPDNPLACYANMLIAARRQDWSAAGAWLERAQEGRPIRDARAPQRAVATLYLLRSRGRLPLDTLVLESGIVLRTEFGTGERERARAALETFIAEHPNSVSAGLARALLARPGPTENGPADGP
jgi:tetratricopeptide (TPR) repeat protein